MTYILDKYFPFTFDNGMCGSNYYEKPQ